MKKLIATFLEGSALLIPTYKTVSESKKIIEQESQIAETSQTQSIDLNTIDQYSNDDIRYTPDKDGNGYYSPDDTTTPEIEGSDTVYWTQESEDFIRLDDNWCNPADDGHDDDLNWYYSLNYSDPVLITEDPSGAADQTTIYFVVEDLQPNTKYEINVYVENPWPGNDGNIFKIQQTASYTFTTQP